MKNKCLCSLVLLFMCVAQMSAQWVVSDPTLTTLSKLSWAKQLSEAAKQYGVLDKSKNILGESLDLYKKVSGFIKNSRTVKNILERQTNMLKIASIECTRNDIYAPEAYDAYKDVINDVMDQSLVSFDLLRDVISTSASMTDGERLKIILDLDTKLQNNENRLLDERKRFNNINDAIKRIAALKSTPKN